MTGKKEVEATLDDLPSVATNPIMKAVGATITLDEEPIPVPGETQLLTAVDEGPTDLRRPAVQLIGVSADAAATQPRRRAPLKSDAFESSPALAPTSRDESAPRGPPAAWEKAAVWTPGLIALTAVGVLMLLVVLFVLLRG